VFLQATLCFCRLLCVSAGYSVFLQATLCVCNIASNGDECCRELYNHNVLADVIPILHLSDAEIVHMALCLVEMILHACPEARFFFQLCSYALYAEWCWLWRASIKVATPLPSGVQ